MNSTLSRRAAIGWTTLGQVAVPLSGLVLSVLLARSLGPDGRGYVAAATAPLLLAVTLASLGIPESLTHYTAKRLLSVRVIAVAAGVAVVAGAVSSAILFMGAETLAGDAVSLGRTIRLCALFVVPSLALGVLRGIGAGLGRWRLIALERLILGLSRLAIVVLLSLTERLSPTSAALVIAATPLVAGLAYCPLLGQLRISRTRTLKWREVATAGQMFSYGGRVWLGSLGGVLLLRLDQSVMAPLAGVAELGLYAVAVSLAEIPSVITNILREVYFTRASGGESGLDVIPRVARVSTLAVGLVSGCLLIAAYPITYFLFGAGFTAAVPSLVLLSVAIVLTNPGSLAGVALSAAGRPGLRSAGLAIALIVNVGLLFALAPSMGAVGASLATLAGTAVALAWNFHGVKRLGLDWWAYVRLERSDLRQLLALGRMSR
ncbi:oligosaccharide flippase family protein [Blastococcus sp. SYSU DS0973]